MPALAEQTIKQIDRVVEAVLPAAREACPNSTLAQYRYIRERILEDVPPAEAAHVAMQCDHYFFCLHLNSGTDTL